MQVYVNPHLGCGACGSITMTRYQRVEDQLAQGYVILSCGSRKCENSGKDFRFPFNLIDLLPHAPANQAAN